jgi:4-hydroxybenzoyl-CoA thioesterase
MAYMRAIPVEFNHCDPAGIVFYPRYFEMTNSVVENFFSGVVGYPFARMVAEGRGVPTAGIEIDFRAASRLGDMLDFRLEVARLGRSSVTVSIAASCAGETRLEGKFTLVWLGPDARPEPWPATIRATFTDHLTGTPAP